MLLSDSLPSGCCPGGYYRGMNAPIPSQMFTVYTQLHGSMSTVDITKRTSL